MSYNSNEDLSSNRGRGGPQRPSQPTGNDSSSSGHSSSGLLHYGPPFGQPQPGYMFGTPPPAYYSQALGSSSGSRSSVYQPSANSGFTNAFQGPGRTIGSASIPYGVPLYTQSFVSPYPTYLMSPYQYQYPPQYSNQRDFSQIPYQRGMQPATIYQPVMQPTIGQPQYYDSSSIFPPALGRAVGQAAQRYLGSRLNHGHTFTEPQNQDGYASSPSEEAIPTPQHPNRLYKSSGPSSSPVSSHQTRSQEPLRHHSSSRTRQQAETNARAVSGRSRPANFDSPHDTTAGQATTTMNNLILNDRLLAETLQKQFDDEITSFQKQFHDQKTSDPGSSLATESHKQKEPMRTQNYHPVELSKLLDPQPSVQSYVDKACSVSKASEPIERPQPTSAITPALIKPDSRLDAQANSDAQTSNPIAQPKAASAIPSELDLDAKADSAPKTKEPAEKHESTAAISLVSDLAAETNSVPKTSERTKQSESAATITPEPDLNTELDFTFNSSQSIEEEQIALRAYGQSITSAKCPICAEPLFKGAMRLISLGKELAIRIASDPLTVMGPQSMYSAIPCSQCNSSSCLSCGKRARHSQSKSPSESTTPGHNGEWCCGKGRLFVIWLLLCGHEWKKPDINKPKARTEKTTPSAHPSITPSQNRNARPAPGTGYGDSVSVGSQMAPKYMQNVAIYGGNSFLNTLLNVHGLPDSNPAGPSGSGEDELLAMYFEALKTVFPTTTATTLFDDDPPAILHSMVRRSPLIMAAADQLKHTSVSDMVSRQRLFGSILGFLELVAVRKLTADWFLGKRITPSLNQQLIHVSLSRPNDISDTNFEDAKPLAEILRLSEKPAQRLIDHMQANLGEYGESDADSMLQLNAQICRLAEYAKESAYMPAAQLKRTDQVTSRVDKIASLAKWHAENSVVEVTDEQILQHHAYRSEAENTTQAALRPKRMRTIVREVLSLASSLPAGISLRHGSSRFDVMKFLIAGPQDTPYENGLYEFDLWCTAEYPNLPPKILFRTACNFRINPNLYEEGKVCLSMLGTWKGEQWRPGVSTILQVLVSIQGMIFCEYPWVNEPGRENEAHTSRSMEYNDVIRSATMANNILRWPSNDFCGELWKEIVQRHYEAYAAAMWDNARVWKVVETELGPNRLKMPLPWNLENTKRILAKYLASDNP